MRATRLGRASGWCLLVFACSVGGESDPRDGAGPAFTGGQGTSAGSSGGGFAGRSGTGAFAAGGALSAGGSLSTGGLSTGGSLSSGGAGGTAPAGDSSGRAGTGGTSGPALGGAGPGGSGVMGQGAAEDGGEGGSRSDGGAAGEGGAPERGGSAGALAAGAGGRDAPVGLSWPIDCIPGETCVNLGYPDFDEDGRAHDCGAPGYTGHQGTDIGITFAAQAAGTAVRAAADGIVLFAFDGKYDQCPNASEPDCQPPPSYEPSAMTGTTVCTPVGPYCGTGEPGCFWCFEGGNVIVVRHEGVPSVFATRYDHLKKGSVLVKPGDAVSRGQKLAEAASAGNSTGPHLHFEVWGTGFYELVDPWAGPCGPNTGPSLWAHDPPWQE